MSILRCVYFYFWSLIFIIYCYCLEKGCLDISINFSFCVPHQKSYAYWTTQGWVNIHFWGAHALKMTEVPRPPLFGCGSSEMFSRVTADELKHWSRMSSDGWPLFKLSEASACLNKTTVGSNLRARGLSSRQWMGTNLCTCVGSMLFVTTSVGGVPSNASTFTLTYTARLIHALQVCIVIPQAASFKANRLMCS